MRRRQGRRRMGQTRSVGEGWRVIGGALCSLVRLVGGDGTKEGGRVGSRLVIEARRNTE